MNLLKEFKPSLLFLGKFVGLYLVLNLLYGLYINSYAPNPDPLTISVAKQTSFLLDLVGSENKMTVKDHETGVWIDAPDQSILSVYEGCNGLNVAIVFVCFLLAYGKPRVALVWFIPLGFVVIHLFNLARIFMLFEVTIYFPDQVYFMHKYLFTIIIYSCVFLLWIAWVVKLHYRFR